MADNSDIIGALGKGSTSQTIFVSDLISEGPIYGLVNGEASVYLNDIPLVEPEDATYTPTESNTITFSGSATGTLGSAMPGVSIGTGALRGLHLQGIDTITGVTVTHTNGSDTFTLVKGGVDFTTKKTTGEAFETVTSARLVRQNTVIKGEINSSGVFIADAPITTPTSLNNSDYTVYIDKQYFIASANTTTVTCVLTPPAGTYDFYIGPMRLVPTSQANLVPEDTQKVNNTSVQFRYGAQIQKPLTEIGGVGGTAAVPGTVSGLPLKQVPNTTATSLNLPVFSEGGYPEGVTPATGTPVVIGTGASNGFNLSASQIAEVDELRISIAYGALSCTSEDSGRNYEAAAIYDIAIQTELDGEFSGYISVLPQYATHFENTKAPISFEHTIQLEPLRPFDNFSVRITRLTRDLGRAVNQSGLDRKSSYQGDYSASVVSVFSVFKEKFVYPYSAYSGVTFSSEEYSSLPRRSYDCRGLLVKIPDTYTTREKAADGIASYSGFWGGSFKAEKEYTDNPAWIFYDIVENNRYGCGDWIQEADINKFALYRIARYCDELVDDGNGGLEPRFRANVYLTKAEDVYKVLKDMATIFTGMLYFLEGQVTPVLDSPADPIYNFTKGNVIDGVFNYESTGAKTRVNQVIVSWNNPANNYELEALIVEDRNAIMEANRIISQTAVAFGTTSEGQATRYGRWKLFTAQKQTEIINFKTALAAGFLQPGDIISVQDADRYGTAFSGRLSTGNTASTVYLDRTITLKVGYSYELSVLITTPATYLAQDSATISAVVYSKGDLIAGVVTESAATSLYDDSGDLVATSWKPFTHTETRNVTTVAGDTAALTVAGSFSEIPEASSIWALKEYTAAGDTSVHSSKLYRILGIMEESKNTYSISAVEHYNEKYDAIDKDYALANIPDLVFPPEDSSSSVPPPKNLYVLTTSNFKKPGEELELQWDAPDYDHIKGYEIATEIETSPAIIQVGSDRKRYKFNNVKDGYYIFRVRTVSTKGNKSKWALATIDVQDNFRANVPRLAMGVAQGAYSTTNIFVKHDPDHPTEPVNNVLTFEDNGYALSPIHNEGIVYTSNVLESPTYEISVDNIVIQNVADPDPLVSFLTSSFIYFDASLAMDADNTDSPYRLVDWSFLALKDLLFWSDANLPTFTDLTGTVNVSANDNIVEGTGTSFLTELEVGDIIKLSTENQIYLGSGIAGDYGAKGALVVAIISDTRLVIDRSFDTAVSGYTPKTTNLQIDFDEDCIIARVWKPFGFQAGDQVQFNSFLTMKPSLVKTFYQNEPPMPATLYNLRIGDIWYDTNDGNRMYRWDGTTWVSVADSRQERTTQCWFLDTEPTLVHPKVDIINNGDYWYDITAPAKSGAYKRIDDVWVAIEYNALGRSLSGGYFWDSVPNIQDDLHPDYKPKFVMFWTSSEPDDSNVPGGGSLEDNDIWYEYADTNVSAWKWDNTLDKWVSFKSQGDLSTKDKIDPEDVADDFYFTDVLIVNNTAAPGNADYKVTAGAAYLGGTAHTISSEITGSDYVDSVEDGKYQAYIWQLYDENLSHLDYKGASIQSGDVTYSGSSISAINPTSFNTVAYDKPGQVVVTIIGGGGTGAKAEPVFGGAAGMVTSINVTNGGSGYNTGKIPYIIMGQKIPTPRSIIWANIWKDDSSALILPRSTNLRLDGDLTGGVHANPILRTDTNVRDSFVFIGDSITAPAGGEDIFGPPQFVAANNNGVSAKSWANQLVDNGNVLSDSVVDAVGGRTIINYAACTFATPGSKVVAISGSGGTGYDGSSGVSISGGGGFGATAQIVLNGSAIDRIEVTNWGSGYTGTPSVTLTGNGSGVTPTATMSSGTGFSNPTGDHKIVLALGTNDVGNQDASITFFQSFLEDLIDHFYTFNREVALILPYRLASSDITVTESYRTAVRAAAAAKSIEQVWDIPLVSHTRGEWEPANGGVHINQSGQNMLYREFYNRISDWSSIKPTRNKYLTLGYSTADQEDIWRLGHALGAGYIQDVSSSDRTGDILISWASKNAVVDPAEDAESYVVLHHNGVNRLQTYVDGVVVDNILKIKSGVNAGYTIADTGFEFNITDVTEATALLTGVGGAAGNVTLYQNNVAKLVTRTTGIEIPDGTNLAPSLTFASGTTTGLSGSATQVKVSTAGAERALFDSNGLSIQGYLAATDYSGYLDSQKFAAITAFGKVVQSTYDKDSFSLSSHDHTLDSLSNVTITGVSTDDVLQWNGTAWVNAVGGSGSVAFDDLTSKTGGTGDYWTSGTFRGGTSVVSIGTMGYATPGTYASTHHIVTRNSVTGFLTENGTEIGDLALASHDHTFNSLTSKTSGTGDYATTGNFSSARVLVGTGSQASPSIAFTSNSDTGFYLSGSHIQISNDNSFRFRFASAGNFHADGNITAYSTTTTSDPKLKNFIGTIKSAKERILSIEGWEWTWKRNGEHSAGVRSDEVKKIFPELVTLTENLNTEEMMESVNYNGLIGVLINAFKEEVERNDTLEARLVKLEELLK